MSEVFHPAEQSKRTAFTLAEVLITLGIIGVVAALTMPVLINNIQDKDLESRYNKAKNMLTNGYKLMTVKEDMDSPYDLFLSVCEDEPCLSKYHNKYFKILKDTTNGFDVQNLPAEYSIKDSDKKSNFSWTNNNVVYVFTTNDGFIYGLLPDEDNQTFSIVTDVNSKNKPNTVKKDLYKFRFDDRGILVDVTDEFDGGECSLDHPEGCMTEEECHSVDGVSGCSWCEYTYWENDRCHAYKGSCDC